MSKHKKIQEPTEKCKEKKGGMIIIKNKQNNTKRIKTNAYNNTNQKAYAVRP